MTNRRTQSIAPATACLGLLSLLGCVSFNTAYERIDADATRLLCVQYEPAEAAPGDTVRAMFVFAGEPVTSDDIDWRVSYRILRNNYGADTAIDIHPLDEDGMVPVDTQFSASTYTVAFKFRIPDSIMYRSSAIPDDWASWLAGFGVPVPDSLAALSKTELLGFLDYLSTIPPQEAGVLVSAMQGGNTLLAVASQFVSVRLRLFASVRDVHMGIRSDYTVRYTNRFARIPGVPVHENHNPILDSARILKVKGVGLSSFVPGVNSQSYDPVTIFSAHQLLTDTPTVVIDKNYSYFLQAFGGGADSINLLSGALSGGSRSADSILEQLGYQWFFQIDTAEANDVKAADLPQFADFGMSSGSITLFTPALDARVASVRWWVQVCDQITLQEASRPRGGCLYEMRCRFSYTQAYLDQAKK